MDPRRPSPDRSPSVPWRLASCATLIAAGVALRIAYLPARTEDLTLFLIPWMTSAEASGPQYLRHAFTNYAPFYEHCLALMALFPGSVALRVKAFSMLFDVMLALTVARIAGPGRALIAFSVTVALPTIALNSAFLAQSDSIYATMTMLSLLACIRRRPVWAMLAFSAAIAIKLQAILFAPVLVLLFLERRQPLWTFLLIPVGYVAFALPMLAVGRPVAEIVDVYATQFDFYQSLSANAPNAWAIAQKIVGYDWGVRLGLPAAAIATMVAVLLLWRARTLDEPNGLLLAAAILLILVPFGTPKMHDRYFYLVDPVLVALCCRDRRYLMPMLLAQLGSLLAYMPFILDGYFMRDPVWGREGSVARTLGFSYRVAPIVGAIAMGTALVLLLLDAWRRYREHAPAIPLSAMVAERLRAVPA